jgi:glycosyltransferase involved in cell wall biosynthesis
MKIIHCLFTMETGGAQVLAVSLLNEMCKTHNISLVIINNKFNESLLKQLNENIRIFYINRKEGNRNPVPVIKLNLLLLRLKPDIIHSHEAKVAQIVKIKTAKLLHTIHDVGLSTALYHLYDKLIAISDAVYNDVTSKYNSPVRKVYNGIHFDSFKRRKNYELKSEECLRLVQVSRLVHEKKGQDVLLYGLHHIKSKFNFTNFSLDFIGSGNSFEYLKKLAIELGLSENVNFLGERDRDWLFANLSGYHLLIQPSTSEGFGLTILEGFAAGLPVLASEIDGPAEIISQTKGGFLFNNGDSMSCAKELYHILEIYSTNQMAGLMDKTIDVMQHRYSIKSCVNQYLEEYALLKSS